MVSSASIAAMAVTAVLWTVLPIGLIIYWYRKQRISLKAVVVGAAVFIVFQLLTRIPLLGYLGQQDWYQALASNRVVLGLGLALSAGLFEEVGRYLGFRYLLRGLWERKNGIAYGLGHGGIEALLLVGLVNVNNIVVSLAIDSGAFDTLLAPQLGEAAELVKTQLLTASPVLFLVAGIERVFALVLQVALSLLVLASVMNRRPALLGYAILLHALINFPAAFQDSINIYLIEAWLLVAALVAWRYIRSWRDDQANLTPEV